MILASATDLGRQYSGDPIFEGLAFELRAGERVGLVGPNGAGKTTLLRVLARIDMPDYGQLFIRPGVRVGLLKQEPDYSDELTLIEVARTGIASLIELQHELEEASREISEADDAHDLQRATRRYEQIRDQIEHRGAFAIDHRVEEVLLGLGFTQAEFSRPARTFSGGQQSRVMLAKLLLESPDMMLLDEPSNHLDIETTEWLEAYLARQPVAMVVVSHDRQFLDAIVTKIWELYFGSIEPYPGNYTQYWRLRQEKVKVLERQAQKQQAEVADLKEYIAKYAAGQRAKQAKDREKKLARITRVETMREIESPAMGFGDVERAGDVVIDARNISKAYDRLLFSKLDLAIQRGQCVGVIGPNGAGKSTLIKILIGRDKSDSGEVKLGHKVSIGYYDQGLESLPADTPIVRAVWPEAELDWVEQDTRDLLARFGLKGDVVFQTVGQLSGGEKGKAALARLAATGANVLVMDEPTNHLDIWSCDALERSIKEFEGTVLVVSHDRYFLNQVVDRLVVIASGNARVVEGDYDTYKRMIAQACDDVAKNSIGKPGATLVEPAEKPRRRRKFPFRKPAEIEREIGEVESGLAEVETALGRPETFRDAQLARDTRARYEALMAARARLYEHWEEAMELNA